MLFPAEVKDAFQAAQDAGAIGDLLSGLFRQAITTGKRARNETEIGQGARSLGQVAVSLARATLGDLKDRTALLVGVGKISKIAGRALVKSGLRWLFVANRTFERAVEVAQSLGGRAVHFDALAQGLTDADLVIVATGAPHIVLHENDLRAAMEVRAARPFVVIDLAVPRNVDPAARWRTCGCMIWTTWAWSLRRFIRLPRKRLPPPRKSSRKRWWSFLCGGANGKSRR